MKVTEGPWEDWEVVGWMADGSYRLTRGTRSGVAACVWGQPSSEGWGWAVWPPGGGRALHRGPETGEAGRLAAEAALRETGIPVGEPERDPRVNPEHGDVLRFPDGEVIVVGASSADGVDYTSSDIELHGLSCRADEWPKWTKDAVVLWPIRRSGGAL